MSYFRLHHVFWALMGVSAIVAFLVPPQIAMKLRPQIERIFEPVSLPVASIASVISNRIAPPSSTDRRSSANVRLENQQLRNDVALLRIQLDEMYRRDAELSKLGAIKNQCRLVKVIGADTGSRESLAIAGSSLQGIKDDMYVLYPGGMVGQVRQSGPGGAQVRLITDRDFHIGVRFVRFAKVRGKTVFEPLATPVVLADGAGDGTLLVRELSLAQVGFNNDGTPNGSADTLREGSDYAVLFDADCPRELQGQTIGRVIRISPRPDARMMAQVRLQPNANLKKLREVMVLTGEN